MPYIFTGFFARPRLPTPEILPKDAQWRVVTSPFDGVGVYLPHMFTLLKGHPPTVEAVEVEARELGLAAAEAWLYLDYRCWGGPPDFVWGFGKSDEKGRIGPIFVSGSWEETRPAFIALMAHFGLSEADAIDFAPFRRGFWGSQR